MSNASSRGNAPSPSSFPASRILKRSLATIPLLIGASLLPQDANACACGCAVFDVGTSSLLPSGPGGTVFLKYDFLDQTQNWSGTSRASSAANVDKDIRTDFFVAGGQYMFNASWGVMAEIPYTDRTFRTEDPSDPGTFEHAALGDVRLMGVYSGFSPDMSTGIIFGAKLPTGDSTYAHFDSDTEISSGSTDILIGGYHSGSLTKDGAFGYYAQGIYEHEVATEHAYRPGPEFNGAFGASYNNLMVGDFHVAPIFQMIYSQRNRDGGAAGDPLNTGYQRVLASPGIEFDRGDWKFYTDIEVPVYLHMNGEQLVAPWSLKTVLSYTL